MMGMGRGWGLDVRFLVRSLWRERGYVATAILVLACAVGVNATVYSYVRGTLLYEPPYPEPDDIMVVWGSNVANGQLRDVISGPNYLDFREHVTALDPVAAFHSDGVYLTGEGRPEVLEALSVTSDFFRVLDVQPALGRLFEERDRTSSAPATMVVTHGFWRDRLDSDPGVIGSALDIAGEPSTVIGVLPEGFEFIAPAPLFLPLRDDVLGADGRGRIHYHVLGRLAAGASVADAMREMPRIEERIEEVYAGFEGWSFLVEPLHEVTVAAVRPVILTLTATVALVLLVALVNLATLFRIRACTRAEELGVRAALGAGRLGIARVLALETVGLAASGAGLGLVAAPFLLERVAGMVPLWIPIPESAARVPVLHGQLGADVAAVAFGVAVLGALVLTAPTFLSVLRGRGPARATRGRVHAGIPGTRLLVGVELAIATVLCLGAALTARSAARLLSTEVGLQDQGLLTLDFGDVWNLDAADQVAYFRDVVQEVERVPGVRRAGVIDYVDFQAEDDFAVVYLLDRSFQPVRDMREEWRRVDQGLFDAAGMEMRAGRTFASDDFLGVPRTAVINDAFAAKHYRDRSPLGEFISTHDEQYRDLEIVGVVADVHSLGPASPPPPMLYVPNQGSPRGTQGLYVRVDGDPMSFGSAVRDAVWAVDPSQPIDGIRPMTELVDSWVAIPRATRALVLGLATLAWLLSAIGVFGVVSYAVRTRRSELGIRLALGASPGRLEADQMRAISPVVVLGVTIGLGLGALAARASQAILYGVSPLDPLSLAGALTVMATAALGATYLPARRVGSIDPTEVIRAE
jgi:putative ABC transport system permease protein